MSQKCCYGALDHHRDPPDRLWHPSSLISGPYRSIYGTVAALPGFATKTGEDQQVLQRLVQPRGIPAAAQAADMCLHHLTLLKISLHYGFLCVCHSSMCLGDLAVSNLFVTTAARSPKVPSHQPHSVPLSV